ncbi:acyltransferase [Loa loa]|uniref:Acyltransferase n=1 Tax=Loa loa TaxID=7209 RepID=A0A1I7W2X5_LOALO|nr:acyltransferase [Loa loa]EFO25474.1 acyltransferase [Loa loa]
MLNALLSIYIGWLLGLVLTTVLLIICGYGWGPLPHLYVKLVKFVQNFYPHNYPQTTVTLWPAIIKRCDTSLLRKHRDDSLSSFHFSEIPMVNAFDVCSDAFKAGFEAIIQDQLSVAFDSAPPFYSTLLERPDRLPFPDAEFRISRRHIFGYFVALIFRYGVLLPIRLCLILISLLFSTSAILADHLMDMTDEQKIRVGVTNCRLFCAAIGLVAKYHNRQYRPKQPGIAVANHLSPNDVQAIYADIDPSDGYGFTVTGQRQTGLVFFIESIAEKFVPTLWLERHSTTDRKRFMDKVLREAKANGPVLLFPEGYCTNNTRVLQFRKAVFEDSVIIYPIAIRQNARFGDSFWSESNFSRYLLRILTSWAIVYDVTYLEPHQKRPGESNQDFAQRVQRAIAKTADVESITLDGRLWYMKSEQQRLKTLQMKNLAKRFKDLITEQTGHVRSVGMESSKSFNGIKSTSMLSTVPTSAVSLM